MIRQSMSPTVAAWQAVRLDRRVLRSRAPSDRRCTLARSRRPGIACVPGAALMSSTTPMGSQTVARDGSYVLGQDQQKVGRLDRQAALIDAPTRLLLQAAGIGDGLRVLDLGTGLGHVARIA